MTTLTARQFLLPDVGEGLTEAEIVTWHVAVGDTVAVNQTIVEIETAKSIVELPTPFAGEVLELLVAAGETANVGTPIISIGTHSASPPASDQPADPGAPDGEPKLLVGYGAKDSDSTRRRRVATGRKAGAAGADGQVSRPRAKPPVRKLAKDLGVDLTRITPTGENDTVVRADVLAAAERGAGNDVGTTQVRPEGSEFRDETRIPIKGVRKHTAAAMVASAFTAPHVTEFVTVDVTRTMALRDVIQRRREFHDIKLTALAFVARAYLLALRRTPLGVARWDSATAEIVVPSRVNLGIAAATPRGLVVPNIKDAHALGLADLASAITELAATARAGKSSPESMSGGNTTITNVGVFGVDTGTPILNPGESAILAVGAIRRKPWVVDHADGERIEARSVLQLALSFDHRVMDGQQGSELLADTAALLTEPGLAVL